MAKNIGFSKISKFSKMYFFRSKFSIFDFQKFYFHFYFFAKIYFLELKKKVGDSFGVKFSDLSIYEVFRAIPALLDRFWTLRMEEIHIPVKEKGGIEPIPEECPPTPEELPDPDFTPDFRGFVSLRSVHDLLCCGKVAPVVYYRSKCSGNTLSLPGTCRNKICSSLKVEF